MRKIFALLSMISVSSFADEIPLKIGGLIDTYYAYDFNAPSNHEREFTTQPVRHNEFNINLAYLDATIKKDKTRARFAYQIGQSVNKNTVGEPRLGATSGPEDAKHIQEAFIGKRIGEKTWVDGGIFLGNIGAESWISKDNWTYSRALNLDYVPYYSAGVRLEHQIDSQQSVQFQILNGWQNMSENNHAKAIGMQYKNQVSERTTFTYNNFLGDEQVVPNPKTSQFNSRFRGYHNFIVQFLKNDEWNFLGAIDIGHQAQQNNNGVDVWGASTLTVRKVINKIEAVAFRAEYYNDRHQANVVTNSRNGFQVVGASMNYDQKIDSDALWRTELRGFSSKDKIYPKGSKYTSKLDGFLVTSLTFWF
ncbi:MAG: outer membrane beta-barrel protein [Bacteriovoracaceae bacterium]